MNLIYKLLNLYHYFATLVLTYLLIRNEAQFLSEKIVDIQAKAKLWCTQTKLAAQSELQAMRLKVDNALDQVSRLKMYLANSNKLMEVLHSTKRDLKLQLGLMVPMSDFQASKEEANKLREDNGRLEQQLLAVKGEVEDYKCKLEVQSRRFAAYYLVACSEDHLSPEYGSTVHAYGCNVRGQGK